MFLLSNIYLRKFSIDLSFLNMAEVHQFITECSSADHRNPISILEFGSSERPPKGDPHSSLRIIRTSKNSRESKLDANHMRLYFGKARALGTTHIPCRGRGVDLEGKEVPVFIGPQGGKEKGESRGFPDLNNVYSQEMSMGGVQGKSLMKVQQWAHTWSEHWQTHRFKEWPEHCAPLFF